MARDQKTRAYAKAIFDIANAEGQGERVADELFRIARTLETETQLRQTLTDIAIPTDAKEKLIEELLGTRAAPQTVNALKLVIGASQTRQLLDIADEVAEMVGAQSRREVAEVRTAVELSDEQVGRLAEALGKATNKDVSVKVIVDPSVIGGVFARVGDVVIDGTVRHKLQLLREHMGVSQ